MLGIPLVVAVAVLLGPAAGRQSAAMPEVPALVRQLRDPDPWKREAAREALVKIRDASAVDPLVAALRAPDVDPKSVPVLLEALSRFNDPRKIPALIAHARRDPLLRDTVAGQLAALGQPAVSALVAEIGSCETVDEEDLHRGWTAGTLGRMGEPGVQALLTLSRDPVPCRRAFAIPGLENAGDDPGVAAAIRAAVDDSDREVRNAALTVIDSLLSPTLHLLGDSYFTPFVVPLIRRLGEQADSPLRPKLVEVLEKIGDRRAVPAIRALLEDEDEEVREACAEALKTLARPANPLAQATARMHSPSPAARVEGIATLLELDANHTPLIIPLLQDKDPRVRRAAAEALGELNAFAHDPRDEGEQDTSSVPPLIAALNDPAAEVRETSASALGLIEDDRALRPLAARLHDADPRVVRASILALRALANVDAGPPLAALYASADQATRIVVLSALWDVCDPRTIPVFVGALGDPVLRDAAGSALGCVLQKQRDPRAVDALLAALAATARPSFSFLNSVGATRDRRALPPLSRLAAEGSEVRGWALSALGDLGDPDGAPILAAGLRDPDAATRVSAAVALAKLEHFRVTAEMIDALVDDHAGVRGWAAKALARSRDPRAVAPLVRAMGTGGPAITALGETNAAEAVDPLIGYLLDETNDGRNRVLAAESLGRLGDGRALPPLLSLLNEQSPSLVGAAVSALGAIGDRRALEPLRALEQRLAASPDPRDRATLRHVRDAIAKISKQASGSGLQASELTGSGRQPGAPAAGLWPSEAVSLEA